MHRRISRGIHLYEGDCTQILPRYRRLGLRVPLVLADPPYGINWQAAGHDRMHLDQDARKAAETFVPLFASLLSDNSVMGLFSREDVEPVWAEVMKREGLTLQPTRVWRKPSAYHDRRKKEVLLVGYKGEPKTYRCPVELNHQHIAPGDERWERSQSPKPPEMMEALLDEFTVPGDVVLDGCMGSSPIGRAAVHRGRRYIGVEYLSDSYEEAVARLARTAALKDLLCPDVLPSGQTYGNFRRSSDVRDERLNL